MKNIKIILCILGLLFFYCLLRFEIFPSIIGGKGIHAAILAKTINDSSGCYMVIDKHYTIRVEDDGDNDYKYKLYKDNIYTKSFTYQSQYQSLYEMIDQLFYNYKHPYVKKKIDIKKKPVYKFYSKTRC
jgi:hypothetical protein